MALRAFKPTSAGRRFYTVADFNEITRDTPERSLVEPKHSTVGRNHYGRITSRFRGGGHKQKYRVIDFKRQKIGVPAKVAHIEYDPNRTARIALLHYADGVKTYILAPDGLKQGDTVVSSRNADIRVGIWKKSEDGRVGVITDFGWTRDKGFSATGSGVVVFDK